jgi:amino acid transporter
MNVTVVFIAFGTSFLIQIEQKIHVEIVFIINLLGVRVFGELEFWFSSLKVLALIGLLLMGIIIDLGGNPKHDRVSEAASFRFPVF